MKTKLLILLFFVKFTYSQVGIGTTNPNAALDITSSNDGLLIPRVNLTGTNDVSTVITKTESELVYNTSTVSDVTPGYYYWNGALWVRLNPSQSNDWSVLGNLSTVSGSWAAPGTNFIGTIDNQDLFVRTNNTNAIRVKANGAIEFGGEELTYAFADAKYYFENSSPSNLMGIYNYYNPNYNGIAAYTAFRNINSNAVSSVGDKQGIWNEISPVGTGRKVGIVNSISDQVGVSANNITGVNNSLTINNTNSARIHAGYHNNVNFGATGRGIFRGVSNFISTPAGGTHTEDIYGVYNSLTINTTGTTYGSYTVFGNLGNGNKYGNYVSIPIGSGGIHYGVYSDVQKAGSYAGYFLGNLTAKRDVANDGVFFVDNAATNGFAGMYFSEGAFSTTNYRGHVGHVNSGSILAQPGTFQIASGNRDMLFGATNGSNLFTERMRINNDTGYVGINTNPTNAGSGDSTPATSTLHVNGSVAMGITNQSIANGATYVIPNTISKLIVTTGAGGSCTVTLPAASTCVGRIVSLSRGDAATRTVTINTAGGNVQSIGGSLGLSTTLAVGELNVNFWSDGNNWYR